MLAPTEVMSQPRTSGTDVVHVLVLAQGDPRNIARFCELVNKLLLHNSAHEVKLLDFCMASDQLPRFLGLATTHEYKVQDLSQEAREGLELMARAFGYSEPVPNVDQEFRSVNLQHLCVLVPLGVRRDNHH